jgi:membrane peptidoglycan carboxypeptidase
MWCESNLRLFCWQEWEDHCGELRKGETESELEISESSSDTTDAPYLVDSIHEELLKDYSEDELISGGLSIYTSLAPNRQKAAVEAIARSMAFVEDSPASHIIRPSVFKERFIEGTAPIAIGT